MKRIAFLFVAVATVAGIFAFTAPASGRADEDASPIYGVRVPSGYRDWSLISVAPVGVPLNDLRAKLGNDLVVKAYREGKLPFPDGTIIARLARQQVTSEENNNAICLRGGKRDAPFFGASQETVGRIFRGGTPDQRPVHGQGFHEIRFDRRLGFRPIQRWQTCRRGDPQNLFSLS
jgi:hypothetical protein